jgi:hypothetical protein
MFHYVATLEISSQRTIAPEEINESDGRDRFRYSSYISTKHAVYKEIRNEDNRPLKNTHTLETK